MAQQQQETAAAKVLRAMGEHQEGNLDTAEVLYREVLADAPAEPNALHYLGVLLYQHRRADEGIALIRRSLEADGDNVHAWNSLGNILQVRNDLEAAAVAYGEATRLDPQMHQAWYNRGVLLVRLGRRDEAIAAFERAVEGRPDYDEAFENIGRLYYRIGDFGKAQETYRAWLAVSPNHPIARHMAAASVGGDVPTPARAGDEYIRIKFDEFASSFDENLARLGYRAPEVVASALAARCAPGAALDVLDAGCGTGLCGPLLRPLARRLEGIDLSEKMVEHARERGVYDAIAVEELSAAMRARPRSVDAVVSADTLVYFGELDEPALAAAGCLRPGGWLVFTVEALGEDAGAVDFRITPSGRYEHGPAYVERVLTRAGFEGVELRREILRMERAAEVVGWLVTARRRGDF